MTVQERRTPKWCQPRAWQLETRWYQCLSYPLRAMQLCAVASFTVALTLLSGVILLVLPRVLQLNSEFRPLAIVLVPCLLFAAVVVGYACTFLSHVLAYGATGQVKDVGLPDPDPWPALEHCGRWVGSLLAGPALPVAASLAYWIHGGALSALDWLIVCEMLVPALGYWLIALVLVSQSARVCDANPVRVVEAVRYLGSRSVTATLLAFSLLAAHGWLGLITIEQLHRSPALGFLLLALCWFSALYFATFGFRLLGLWYHRALRELPRSSTPLWAIPGRAFAHNTQGV